MKKNRKLFRNFLSALLVFVLCFSAAMTAFAEEGQSDAEPAAEQNAVVSIEAEPDAGIAKIVELIREEYGDEAAAGFEKMMGNANMRAFIEALQKKLEEEFPGMSDEEVSQQLENMSDEQTFELMEKIFSDPEILKLSEAVSEDEELTDEMGTLLEILFGDEIDTDDKPKPEKPVSGSQGNGISWTLDIDGTLTISGNGPIVPEYEEFVGMNLPFYGWDDYIDNITRIVVKDGVAGIPEAAFSGSSALKTVVISASVKSIDSEAFAFCENLAAVYFQGDAPDIAEDAFDECSKDLTLYYREGTKGWDKVTGYKLAVWTAASSGESSGMNGQGQPEKTEQSASSVQETAKTAAGSGTPYTGDSGNIWPFILLMAAAVICGGAVIIRMRKKR